MKKKFEREILLSEEQIKDICKRIGSELTKELENEELAPVLVGVLKGAVPFMMELQKNVDLLCYTDFIQISSYAGQTSTGKVELKKDISFDVTGRTVVIIEDIVDTGLSMDFLLKLVKAKGAKRVLVCALFDKRDARINDVKCDYYGSILKKGQFVCGFGLDYCDFLRNDPYVFLMSKEELDYMDKEIRRNGK